MLDELIKLAPFLIIWWSLGFFPSFYMEFKFRIQSYKNFIYNNQRLLTNQEIYKHVLKDCEIHKIAICAIFGPIWLYVTYYIFYIYDP